MKKVRNVLIDFALFIIEKVLEHSPKTEKINYSAKTIVKVSLELSVMEPQFYNVQRDRIRKAIHNLDATYNDLQFLKYEVID